MDLQKSSLLLTIQLYAMLSLSRTDVQKIIFLFSDFITNVYDPLLLLQLNQALNKAVTTEVEEEIKKIFKRYENPFSALNTEEKRLGQYKNEKLYFEPQMCPIQQIETSKEKDNIVTISNKNINLARIPLVTSIKNLLEVDNLFNEMMSYISFLENEKTLLMDFIQGDLWQNLKSNCKKDSIILPLFGYFDDIESGNALGTHSGRNSIGAVYATIPCLPPNFSSKLESLIFSDIFHTADRKIFGNKAVFQYFLTELKKTV